MPETRLENTRGTLPAGYQFPTGRAVDPREVCVSCGFSKLPSDTVCSNCRNLRDWDVAMGNHTPWAV